MIKQWIASILNPIAQYLFEIAMAIPMSVVRMIFLGIFALLAIWVLTMPPQYPDDGEQKKWSDLRLFALIVLVVQSLFYIIF
ncbi:hypothetical protein ACFL6H_10270 [Candidatus Latescibacterota bacterium]